MMKMQSWTLAGVSMILLALLLLGGCSSYGVGTNGSHDEIIIDTDPQHAMVYVDGTEIGMTPLTIRPDEVFQARFTMGDSDTGGIAVYRYVGMLSIKKNGCKGYATQVDDNILARDIHVKLECDPASPQQETRPAIPEQTPASRGSGTDRPAVSEQAPASSDTENPVTAGDAERRLLRIESLYKKGLLSEEEYRSLRRRVLDTL